LSGRRQQLLVALALAACGPPSSNPGHPNPIGSSSASAAPSLAAPTAVVSAPNGCTDDLRSAWLANGDIALACGKELRILDSSLIERRRVDAGLPSSIDYLGGNASGTAIVLIDDERHWRLLDGMDLSERNAGALSELSPSEYQLSPSGRQLALGVRDNGLQVMTLAGGVVSSFAPGSYPSSSVWLADDTLAFCDQQAVRLGRVGSSTTRVLSKVDFCGTLSRPPTGNTLAMTVNESLLRWDTKRSKPLATAAEAPELDCRRYAADIWATGDRMIRLGSWQGIGVAELRGGEVKLLWWRDTPGPVFGATASPNGTRIAAICEGESLCVWDAATGTPQQVTTEVSRHTSRLVALARSAGGQLIATAAHDGAVRMWDLRRGTMSSALDAFAYSTRSSGVTTLTEVQGKLQQLANARCSSHRELDEAAINISPNGDSVIVDSRRSSLPMEKDGRWRSVAGAARGARRLLEASFFRHLQSHSASKNDGRPAGRHSRARAHDGGVGQMGPRLARWRSRSDWFRRGGRASSRYQAVRADRRSQAARARERDRG